MLKRIYEKVYKILFHKEVAQEALKQPTGSELALINELKRNFEAIPEMPLKGLNPSESAWANSMNILKSKVLNDDPRRFLTWDVIINTMFVKDERYINTEFAYLNSNDPIKWREALRESACGQPALYRHLGQSSGNLVHHAYHVARFEQETGVSVNTIDFVFEFGGGYGSMCRLFHNLGFKGKYLIFDLPHFSALQKYYLTSLGYPVVAAGDAADTKSGIYCISDIEQLRPLIEKFSGNADHALFLATWSLSETPLAFREQFVPLLKSLDLFLVGFQDRFKEADNLDYFNKFQQRFPEIEWHSSRIDHMKGHNYLFGKKINR